MRRRCVFPVNNVVFAAVCVFGLNSRPTTAAGCYDGWSRILSSVDEISAMPDTPIPDGGALRNLFITDKYHELSLAFKELTHSDRGVGVDAPRQANWPTIATWASNSVGKIPTRSPFFLFPIFMDCIERKKNVFPY